MSLARRHRQRMTAANAGTGLAANRQATEQADLMGAALHEDYRRLKKVQSIERKIDLKRDEIVPKYTDYVAGVLESDAGGNDTVLMTIMVWRFDIGDLAGGLDIAGYALRHGLDAPDRYERTTAAIVAEQTAETILGQVNAIDPTTPEGQAVANALAEHAATAGTLTARHDMHDQVRAKLHKAWGYALRAKGGHDAEAVHHLKRALELNSQVGVKKDIEKLERAIAKAEAEAKDEGQAQQQGQPQGAAGQPDTATAKQAQPSTADGKPQQAKPANEPNNPNTGGSA